MVTLSAVRAANAHIRDILPDSFTAVFIGATSGIGMSVLKQLVAAAQDKKVKVYVVGRNTRAAEPLLAALSQSNPSSEIAFIETGHILSEECGQSRGRG